MQIALSNMRLQNVVTGHRWMEHMVSETRASWLYHFRVGPSSYVENVLLARCKIQVKTTFVEICSYSRWGGNDGHLDLRP
jgi:hypothetical protein